MGKKPVKRTSDSSSNPSRKLSAAHEKSGNFRSTATINRLNMYRAKPKRDREGKLIKGEYMMHTPEAGAGRTDANRKWFGNTRVIGQDDLDNFREKLSEQINNPYTVLLRANKLPMSLLEDKTKTARMNLLQTESFDYTFGKKGLRKRPKLAESHYDELVGTAEKKTEDYKPEADSNIVVEQDFKVALSDHIFFKGQSKRIWGELYKVRYLAERGEGEGEKGRRATLANDVTFSDLFRIV